jgi:hypothetical protein
VGKPVCLLTVPVGCFGSDPRHETSLANHLLDEPTVKAFQTGHVEEMAGR